VAPPQVVSEARLNSLMASYRADQRTPPATLRLPYSEPLPDNAAAASFVTMDREGNAVACTVSSHGLFGAGRVATGTGIVLAAAPDVTRGPQWLGPMIVSRNDEVRLLSNFFSSTAGGPQVMFAGAATGGAAAASALVGVSLRTVAEKRPLEEAMDAQRLHFEGVPLDTVFVETGVQARPPGLAERGYTIVPVPVLGRVNAISCPGGAKDAPGTCQFRADRRGFGLALTAQ
jgi:gamma-glutamyltranspeptidase / glutathione hydrolase